MQKIECSNCGSNNLNFESTYYKCSHCHTKFQLSHQRIITSKKTYKYISFVIVSISLIIAYVTITLFESCENGEYELNLKEGRFICKPLQQSTSPLNQKEKTNTLEMITSKPTSKPEEKKKLNILDIVTSKNGFKVALDRGNLIDPIGYSGINDPLGTLHYGSTYKIVYNSNHKQWIVTGFHEVRQREETHIYNNANPKEYNMSLWGRIFSFDENGDVFDAEFGKIGRII